MVFQDIIYCLCALLCGTFGAAADLVASRHVAHMEDRAYNCDTRPELDTVQIDPELHPHDNRLLQDA